MDFLPNEAPKYKRVPYFRDGRIFIPAAGGARYARPLDLALATPLRVLETLRLED